MPERPNPPPLHGPNPRRRMRAPRRRGIVAVAALLVALGACSTSDDAASGGSSSSAPTTREATTTTQAGSPTAAGAGAPRRFTAEVWADNWFSLTVNGKLVGEDSVPITTERSFNAETIEFEATYPLTLAVVAKDYKADDSGLEYLGTDRQQMGDGGMIAQITDTTTGKVVAVTGADWRALVVHRAPLDTACETSADPAADCTAEIAPEPDGWTEASFDDSGWADATVYSEADVQPKQGYETISWDPSAELIWTASLKQDNTILWRHTVGAT